MHRRVKAVYGECSLCRSNIVEWLKRFLERPELEDDIRPGQVHRVITPERIVGMNLLVFENHRITVKEIH
ncbi:hypothetical protein TNCT_387861 [Trichonephila clavata]|uniref:Uncharacterized protein n=1 Tax=Trichonephila clavata TaxID=2740835 RepID=A0A8X6HKX5_TRICU|nr:hypothetical protein TNCT_387861 [Trichonephila clavata]